MRPPPTPSHIDNPRFVAHHDIQDRHKHTLSFAFHSNGENSPCFSAPDDYVERKGTGQSPCAQDLHDRQQRAGRDLVGVSGEELPAEHEGARSISYMGRTRVSRDINAAYSDPEKTSA